MQKIHSTKEIFENFIYFKKAISRVFAQVLEYSSINSSWNPALESSPE